MSENEGAAFGGGIDIGALAIVILAMIFTTPDAGWQRQAIKHGAAHYDMTTGAFTWNVPPKPEAAP